MFQSSLFLKFCNTHHNIFCLQWKATSSFLTSQLIFSLIWTESTQSNYNCGTPSVRKARIMPIYSVTGTENALPGLGTDDLVIVHKSPLYSLGTSMDR